MLSKSQDKICTLVIKILLDVFSFITLRNQKLITILRNKYQHMYIKLTIQVYLSVFLSKVQFFWPLESIGVSLLMLISARLEFDSVI